MNLHHLQVFHAVAQCGSISKASERLRISQPAVSRQVRVLEECLGLSLLDRLPRGVRLTEAGQVLAEYACRLSALEARAEAELKQMRALEAGRLSLGASTTIGNYLLPPVLAHFRDLHPGVEIWMEIGNTEQIQRHLLEDRIDLGFTEGFVEDDELEADVFMHDDLVVIAPPDHPLAGRGPLPLGELCHQPCVMREPGSGTRAVLERILMERGVQSTPHMTLGSPEAVKRAVQAGAGLAVASYFTVSMELDAGALTRIPVSDALFQRPLHRIQHRQRQMGPATLAFLALLAETVPPMTAPVTNR